VRRGWISDWNFLSRFVQPFMKAMKPLGSPHSGFFMKLSGLDAQGSPKRLLFEILARDGSGLEIPVTPVILLVRKILRGHSFPVGACPCMGLFSLVEFQHELSSFPISGEWKSMQ